MDELLRILGLLLLYAALFVIFRITKPALNADETAALRRSAGVIREAIDGLVGEGVL